MVAFSLLQTSVGFWALNRVGTAEENRPIFASAQAPLGLEETFATIATVTGERAIARTAPERSADTLASFLPVSPQGSPQVFLVTNEVRTGTEVAWYEVLLPVQPNGTTGFVRARDVDVATSPYRLEVDTARYTLTLWNGAEPMSTYPVGIGTGETPTPRGFFYLTSLLKPPAENTIYGKYAYGLSAHAEAADDWYGNGVIGLHGTNDPTSVGRPSSNGCLRMRNDDITELAGLLPLGTPILIR
ncbi:MAG: L,D-transpeptidase [Actinomycetota bacterium]